MINFKEKVGILYHSTLPNRLNCQEVSPLYSSWLNIFAKSHADFLLIVILLGHFQLKMDRMMTQS